MTREIITLSWCLKICSSAAEKAAQAKSHAEALQIINCAVQTLREELRLAEESEAQHLDSLEAAWRFGQQSAKHWAAESPLPDGEGELDF